MMGPPRIYILEGFYTLFVFLASPLSGAATFFLDQTSGTFRARALPSLSLKHKEANTCPIPDCLTSTPRKPTPPYNIQ